MTTTPIGWAANDGGTTWASASWSVALNSLTTGSGSVSPSIDNTEATVGSAAWDEGMLEINLGASTALGTTGIVVVSAAPLDSPDGTNYQPSFVSSATLYPLDRQRSQQFPLSISAQYLIIRGIQLYPNLMKIAIINNTGVTWPTSGVTSIFYRMRKQAG